MKKIAWLLMFSLLLGGCSLSRKTPDYRVVTGVQVQYRQQDSTIERTYTKSASIQSVLTYLRLLRPFGPVTPEGEANSTCQITLQYSHGPDSVYLQQGQRYLRKDDGDWENINNSYASLLFPLLLLLPSDEA